MAAGRCPDGQFGQQPAAQLPWFHIVTLLTKLADPAEREWYATQAVAQGWSRATLEIKRVRGIGPIEPRDFGSYTFEHLWFTDTVEWAKLVSLRVDYMDGSSKTIKDLRRVKVDQEHQDVIAWEPE